MTELKTLKDILQERRRQINIAFEGKDERMLAHLHIFVNKFEEELTDEAIKWVKNCPCCKVHIVKIQDNDEPEKEIKERDYCFACRRTIKMNNLTEEELKND